MKGPDCETLPSLRRGRTNIYFPLSAVSLFLGSLHVPVQVFWKAEAYRLTDVQKICWRQFLWWIKRKGSIRREGSLWPTMQVWYLWKEIENDGRRGRMRLSEAWPWESLGWATGQAQSKDSLWKEPGFGQAWPGHFLTVLSNRPGITPGKVFLHVWCSGFQRISAGGCQQYTPHGRCVPSWRDLWVVPSSNCPSH